MLQSIRERTHGWIAGLIISLLILSFALWGIHSYLVGNGPNDVVVEVNGVDISKAQLKLTYERMRRELMMQYSSGYTLSNEVETGLKNKALQSLIDFQVLLQASLKEGFRISYDQVNAYVENMQAFQVNGQFSLNRFQQIMVATMYAPGDFMELIRSNLLIEQPRVGIASTSFSESSEVARMVALVNQERDLSYTLFSAKALESSLPPVTEDQINNYYNTHQADYKTPDKISIEYVQVTVKSLMNSIHPTESELKTFYDENVNSFASSGDAKTAKILPFDQVKQKVKEALVERKAREKFANLKDQLADLTFQHPDSLLPAAKALGLTIESSAVFSKDKGSDSISSNVKVREAAFSHDVLSLKNNSDVLSFSPDEMIVLRVKSYVPSAVLSLESVKSSIIEMLKRKMEEEKAKEMALSLQSTLTNSNAVNTIHWNSVGFIGRHSAKVDQGILDALFSMPKPEKGTSTFGIAKTQDGYAVLMLKNVREGQANSGGQQDAFSEEIQNAYALVEYSLYKESLMKSAKIQIEQQDA